MYTLLMNQCFFLPNGLITFDFILVWVYVENQIGSVQSTYKKIKKKENLPMALVGPIFAALDQSRQGPGEAKIWLLPNRLPLHSKTGIFVKIK